MASKTISRRLTFVAWAGASDNHPVDLSAIESSLDSIDPNEQILAHGDALTAVDRFKVAPGRGEPCRFQLLALHDHDTAPSEWGPGAGATPISLREGSYTAFITHVMIWPDLVAAFDRHPNAPGLSRLATYIKELTGERIVFRALYEPGMKERLEDLRGSRTIEYAIHDPHRKASLAGHGGMFNNLLPAWFQQVPSLRVRVAMGRKGRRDAYLPDDLHDDVIAMADHAEEFFDSLVISGHSETEQTPAGNPKTVKVNLLSERLHVAVDLARHSELRSLPGRKAVYDALRDARRDLDRNGKLEEAVEARIAIDDRGT